MLEPREAKEPVARPELGGAELGLLGLTTLTSSSCKACIFLAGRVVLMSLAPTTDRSREPATAEVGEGPARAVPHGCDLVMTAPPDTGSLEVLHPLASPNAT